MEPNTSITWPNRLGNPPYYEDLNGEYASWRRTKLDIKQTYYGRLSQGYELLSPSFAPNEALDAGKEYILFVIMAYTGENDTGGLGSIQRYNEEQLRTFGGSAGYFLADQAWIIEGDAAWRLPSDNFYVATDTDDLAVGKARGETLKVADLVAAMKAGLR